MAARVLLHEDTAALLGGPAVDLCAAMEAEALAVELAIRSDDFNEGMRAFTARRDPPFTDR